MKRAFVALGAVIAIVVAIVFMKCGHGGSPSTAPKQASSSGSAVSASKRIRDVHVDPRTQKRGSLAGVISDAATKAPIAGARVCAEAWSASLSPQGVRELPCTATDAQGAYTLGNLVPAKYAVTAAARTYQPGIHHAGGGRRKEGVTLAAGEAKTGIDIALKGGGVEITGTVSDVTGGPIEGADVRARGNWSEDAGPPTQTDAAGKYSMWVRPGRVSVVATAEGYAPGDDYGSAPGTFDILLTPESSVAGTVVDATSGEPIAGVSVTVEGSEWGGGDGDPRDITDEHGAFRVARLLPGRYVAHAKAPHGFGLSEGSVLVALGQHVEGVVVRLHPAYRITGKVVTPDDKTCEDPSVSVTDLRSQRWVDMVRETDSSLYADGVLPGTYNVEVRCRGFQARPKYDPITIVDKDVENIVWHVDAGATVQGIVTNKRGEPVEGANVWARLAGIPARGQEAWGGGSDETGPDGRYVIAGLRPGSYKLEAGSRTTSGPREGWPVEVTAGPPVEKNLVVEEDGSIAGTVVTASGKPVSGVDVRAMAPGGNRGGGGSSARTADDGTFKLDGVRPGEYSVRASRGWSQMLRRPGTTDDSKQGEPVTVSVGKTSTVRLVVEDQDGTITGTVVDISGAPAADAFVSAARESDAAGASGSNLAAARWSYDDKPVITDTTGAFTLSHLSPGVYTVRAFRRGGGEAFAEHVAVGTTTKLQIKATGSIAGTVTSPAGALDEMMVTLQDPTNGFSRTEQLFRTGGQFTFRDLPAGTFSLNVSSARGKKEIEVTLAEGETKTGIAITLDGFVAVTGRVVDAATKQPVAGMIMMASLGKNGRGDFSNTDPEEANVTGDDGRFTIKDAPVGTVNLRGYPKNFRDSEYAAITLVRTVQGTSPIDLGDIIALKRRLKPGDKAGDLGIKFADQPPGTPIDARIYKVSFIDPQGPAAKTELKVGDVVTSIDGTDITGANAANAMTLMRAPVGTKLSLGLQRGATIEIVLAQP